jgi:hypothetical protein
MASVSPFIRDLVSDDNPQLPPNFRHFRHFRQFRHLFHHRHFVYLPLQLADSCLLLNKIFTDI